MDLMDGYPDPALLAAVLLMIARIPPHDPGGEPDGETPLDDQYSITRFVVTVDGIEIDDNGKTHHLTVAKKDPTP